MNNCEPTLEELLSEPIIQQVMARDGVRADHIRNLMQSPRVRPFRRMEDDLLLSSRPWDRVAPSREDAASRFVG
jgi:hypothetical protein